MTAGDPDKAVAGMAHTAPMEWVIRYLTLLAVVALAVLLATTVASVILRYVFSTPLLGSNEIIQLASVALVTLALGPTAQREIHIRVDVLDKAIGSIGRFVGDVASRGAAVFVLIKLALRSWKQAADALEFGDATNMLSIPLWPFYGLIVLGAGLYAFVLVLQAVDRLIGGVHRNV